jgi:hypothetical protein
MLFGIKEVTSILNDEVITAEIIVTGIELSKTNEVDNATLIKLRLHVVSRFVKKPMSSNEAAKLSKSLRRLSFSMGQHVRRRFSSGVW